MPFNRTIAQVK